MFAEDDLGNRTKNVVQLVAQEMQSIDASLDEKKCLKKAADALDAAGISLKAKKKEEIKKADALFFMSNRQAKEIARLKEENEFLAEASAFFAASRRKSAKNRD